MNEFRTPYRSGPVSLEIGLKQRFLTLGSCFSDAIGSRLRQFKFQSFVNPFGVIYNPISIHHALNHAIHKLPAAGSGFTSHQDVYLNYDFHSTFSSLNKDQLQSELDGMIIQIHDYLKEVDYIVITYGTAWVYTLKSSGKIVANCHKQPAMFFEKRLLSIEEIMISFEKMNEELQKLNPKARIILTLSPVRHIKDTLPKNSVSKAIVRTACHYLAEKFSHVEYFPAYEIMMDDLRDYRFYGPDLIHPNEQAEDYIWERFTEQYMDKPVRTFLTEWKNILSALNHRPFHAASSGHKNFLQQTLKRLEELKSLVNVDDEIKALQSQLDAVSLQTTTTHDHRT